MMKGAELELPPGFRFHPTDEELVNHYLCRKCAGLPIAVPIIAEIDLYKYDPWELPEMARYGEKEWYFFSPRDRKYPNGSRPNRAAGTGYWKATGADKPIGKPKTLGIKKALVFYAGKAPKGIKTNWIMHEYRPANVDRSPSTKNNNLRVLYLPFDHPLQLMLKGKMVIEQQDAQLVRSWLDDWVLCRLYNKKGRMEKHYPSDKKSIGFPELEEDRKPIIKISSQEVASFGMPPHQGSPAPMMNDLLHMDTSESVPRLQTDSSCSEHGLSPEIACDKEVQSVPKWNDLDNALNDHYHQFNFDYMDNNCFQDDPFGPQVQFQMDQLSPYQDIFMLLQKPF